MSISLATLAEKINGQVRLNNDKITLDTELKRVATLATATQQELSFLSNSKFANDLDKTQAGVVILTEKDAQTYSGNAIIHDNPYVAFALAAQLLDTTPTAASGIHPKATIDESASIGANVSIGPGAVISAHASIGQDSIIGANVFIGEGAEIGQGVQIKSNASIHHYVVVHDKVLIHSGVVLGGDGFGYANDKGQWLKIPQTGRVIVGEGTEIGNNTCIDRGALEDTIIGKNCIIDNLVHIAHNVVIGDHSCICGNTGIAGSTTIGKYVVIAGQCAINGHISITDKVQITGCSMVTKNITEPGVYSSGMPALPNRDWQRNTVKLRNIDKLYERVKHLEK